MTEIYGAPSCTFAAFLAHLQAHTPPSPALPEVADIWNLLVDAAVDPTFALAMFHHESTCGTRGRAAATRSWGNIRWRPQYNAYMIERGIVLLDTDGFVGYPSWVAGAAHVVDHLRGRDGTNSYAGMTTLEQIIPTWAPAPTNDPPAYIAAMRETYRELQADRPAPPPATGPRVLLVAGHVAIEQITREGLRAWRDTDAAGEPPDDNPHDGLAFGTGARGEREVNAHVAGLLQRALLNRGVEVLVTDAVYHADVYSDPRGWDLCLALHAHRDPGQRGRIAVPDVIVPPFISEAAQKGARAYRDLFRELYPEITGIRVDRADLGTIGMRQLYTWDYVPLETPSLCVEMGHLEDDAAVLFERNRATIVRALALITTRWLGLPDEPAPPPPQDLAATLDQIIALAQQARGQLGR